MAGVRKLKEGEYELICGNCNHRWISEKPDEACPKCCRYGERTKKTWKKKKGG